MVFELKSAGMLMKTSTIVFLVSPLNHGECKNSFVSVQFLTVFVSLE